MSRVIHTCAVSILLLFSLLRMDSIATYGQEAKVLTTIEPTAIRIGEQSVMTVRVVHDKDDPVTLALPQDTIVSGVELLGILKEDSSMLNDHLRERIYEIAITSFDSAMYTIRNVSARIGNEIITSDDHPNLIVNTVEVDLSQPDKFYDIKKQEASKFYWIDYAVYIYIALGLLLLILWGYLLYRYILSRKSGVAVKEEEVYVDPYDEAITAIQALREEELWRSNQSKEYYTRVTDILRRYIFRVWGIQTADKTSQEILTSLKAESRDQEMYSNLSKILSIADLAKFAKYHPTTEDNLSVLNATTAFVEEYKPKPVQDEEESPANIQGK